MIRRVRGTDVDRAVYLNAWIYGSLALSVKGRLDDSVDVTLEMMNGSCGHRDNLFRDISTCLGWKSRRVAFHNVPVQLAHVGTEVFVDGRWRFFDPTFGIHLVSATDQSNVLSILQARQNFPDVKVMRTLQPPYLGKSIRSAKRTQEQLQDDVLIHPLGDWPLGTIEGTYFLSSLVLEIDDSVYESEITIVASSDKHVLFDEAKLSTSHLDFGYGESYVGYAHILGKYWGRGPVVSKRITFLTQEPLVVTVAMSLRHILPEHVHASIRHAASNFDLESMRIGKRIDEQEVSWKFTISPPMTAMFINAGHDKSAVIQSFEVKIDTPASTSET